MGITNETRTRLFDTIQDALRPLSNGSTTLDFDMITITHGITDLGYVAAIQRTIASRADCLVLVGGGHFLKLALGDYLKFHPNHSSWCIHTVCMEELTPGSKNFIKMFNHMMDAARNTFHDFMGCPLCQNHFYIYTALHGFTNAAMDL